MITWTRTQKNPQKTTTTTTKKKTKKPPSYPFNALDSVTRKLVLIILSFQQRMKFRLSALWHFFMLVDYKTETSNQCPWICKTVVHSEATPCHLLMWPVCNKKRVYENLQEDSCQLNNSGQLGHSAETVQCHSFDNNALSFHAAGLWHLYKGIAHRNDWGKLYFKLFTVFCVLDFFLLSVWESVSWMNL